MRGSIAYPYGIISMQMDSGPVLSVVNTGHRTGTSPHDGGIYRNEEVASSPHREQVVKLDTYRHIAIRNDGWAKVMWPINSKSLRSSIWHEYRGAARIG